MTDREFFDAWIAGDYNRNFQLKPVLDRLVASDEVGDIVDLSALKARVTADEIKMQAFYDEIHNQTGGDAGNAHEWCEHIHDEIDDIWAAINTPHTHPISAITGLQSALDGKASLSHTHPMTDITGLVAALLGKADVVHTHAMADITGLVAALSGKANNSHSHVISDVTNLQTELDGKIAKSPKAAARANVATGTSGLAVTVLGLSVVGANALTRLDEYGTAINDILARLRSCDIITT